MNSLINAASGVTEAAKAAVWGKPEADSGTEPLHEDAGEDAGEGAALAPPSSAKPYDPGNVTGKCITAGETGIRLTRARHRADIADIADVADVANGTAGARCRRRARQPGRCRRGDCGPCAEWRGGPARGSVGERGRAGCRGQFRCDRERSRRAGHRRKGGGDMYVAAAG